MPLIQAKGRNFSLCSLPVLPNFLIFLPSEQEDEEQQYHSLRDYMSAKKQ